MFFHTVDQVIVQSNEVADKRRGAQARALTARQEHHEVTLEIHVLFTVLGRDFDFPWMSKQVALGQGAMAGSGSQQAEETVVYR